MVELKLIVSGVRLKLAGTNSDAKAGGGEKESKNLIRLSDIGLLYLTGLGTASAHK